MSSKMNFSSQQRSIFAFTAPHALRPFINAYNPPGIVAVLSPLRQRFPRTPWLRRSQSRVRASADRPDATEPFPTGAGDLEQGNMHSSNSSQSSQPPHSTHMPHGTEPAAQITHTDNPSAKHTDASNGANDNSTYETEKRRGHNPRAKTTTSETGSMSLRDMLTPTRWSERFRVVFLTFLSFVICNCDRINISVAILPMAKYYGWSQTTVGVIQSAFFWGYVLTQIPGGYFADRFGGKQVLAIGVITWSAMTLLTPAAASSNIGLLLLVRALLGVGEGVAMPAMNNMLSRWVPQAERSRSLSLVYSGMYLGSVIGLWLCPKFIVGFGWPSVFYIFGAAGFVWWGFWQALATSTPQQSSSISDEERAFIADGTGDTGRAVGKNIPWKLLLSKKPTWAIIVAHFCSTWGYFVLLIWLPTYFNQRLGFDLAASSFLSILPWLAMFVSANAGGLLADSLLARGWSVTNVRKTMQTIGFLGPAVFLSCVTATSSPTWAVGFMTSALALGSFSQSGVYANHQDIGPAYSGVLLGISNTGAAIPGIVGVALTGFILDQTGSWNLVFDIAIFFYVLGMTVYNIYGTGERVF